MPALFVVLWSTGFVAAKYGLPYAPPLTFLFLRFVLVAVLMAVVALWGRARWPTTRAQFVHLVIAGLLVHALYLGGVFVAIAGGMAAGTIAMLVGLQPIATVVLARLWFGERVRPRQWLGLTVGLAGVFLVVRHKFSLSGDLTGLLPAGLALAGISVGTLYQKRFCADVDLRAGAVVQFAACALALLPLVLLIDAPPVHWTFALVAALAWSIVVLSIVAISLLYWLLRQGATANVAALFYLVPPVTALMAFVLFGETLDPLALAGMAAIAIGVVLARASPGWQQATPEAG